MNVQIMQELEPAQFVQDLRDKMCNIRSWDAKYLTKPVV